MDASHSRIFRRCKEGMFLGCNVFSFSFVSGILSSFQTGGNNIQSLQTLCYNE